MNGRLEEPASACVVGIDFGTDSVRSIAVDAARKANVGLLAYTSILHADSSKMKLAAEHLETEQYIRASGLPFVFLRNGWYFENHTENLAPGARNVVFLD